MGDRFRLLKRAINKCKRSVREREVDGKYKRWHCISQKSSNPEPLLRSPYSMPIPQKISATARFTPAEKSLLLVIFDFLQIILFGHRRSFCLLRGGCYLPGIDDFFFRIRGFILAIFFFLVITRRRNRFIFVGYFFGFLFVAYFFRLSRFGSCCLTLLGGRWSCRWKGWVFDATAWAVLNGYTFASVFVFFRGYILVVGFRGVRFLISVNY